MSERRPSDLDTTRSDVPGQLNPAARTVRRVLVAEDGQFNQTLIATILRRQGCEIALAENGAIAVSEALAAMAGPGLFDLILMDMQMPEMDGYSATRILRDKGYTGVIVALTASNKEGDRERCLEAGCDAYLTKPISRQALLSVLHSSADTEAPAPFSAATAQKEQNAGFQFASSGPILSSLRDDAEMQAVVAGFVERLGAFTDDLRIAGQSGDLQRLARLAHQLKGAAGGYGFMPVSEAAARLETRIADNAAEDDISEATEHLIGICERVE
ncbi:MAG: response regulator [Roseinatronobacter sp.]